MRLEDGPPDDRGRVRTTLHAGGRIVGHAVVHLSGGAMVISELHAPGHLAEAIERLSARLDPADPFCGWYHAPIADPAVIEAYRHTHMGGRAVAVGTVDQRAVTHASLAELGPLSGSSRVMLSVMYQPLPPCGPLTEAAVWARLVEPELTTRIHTLRAVATGALPDEIRHEVFLFALLDPDHELRRLAGMAISGSFPTMPLRAEVPRLVAHLDDPLKSTEHGHVPGPFDPAHARRNKRYALVWILGLLAMASDARRSEVHLAMLAGRLDGATDRRLMAAAQADTAGHTQAGIGALVRLDPLQMVRYAVLRSRIAEDDRFYWLRLMADEIARGGGAEALHAPSPLSP